MPTRRRMGMTPAEIEELKKGTPKKQRQVHQSDSSVLELPIASKVKIPAKGDLPEFKISESFQATPSVWKKVEDDLQAILQQGQNYCRIHYQSDKELYNLFMDGIVKFYLFHCGQEVKGDFELKETLIKRQLPTPNILSYQKKPLKTTQTMTFQTTIQRIKTQKTLRRRKPY